MPNLKEAVPMADHVQPLEPENAPAAVSEHPGIGEQLRNQRKAKGVSLAEISEHIKIGKKYLEALEEERFDILPSNCETYTRGFLRAYARYLELDDQALLRQYKEKNHLGKKKNEPGRISQPEDAAKTVPTWLPWLGVVAGAGLILAVFLLWPASEKKDSLQNSVEPALEKNEARVEAVASKETGIQEELTLMVKSRERTWITVMADGRQEPDITLGPGENRTWKAKDRFVLWTGNAGGIDVIFNGELQPALGKQGEVRKEVVFERKPARMLTPGTGIEF